MSAKFARNYTEKNWTTRPSSDWDTALIKVASEARFAIPAARAMFGESQKGGTKTLGPNTEHWQYRKEYSTDYVLVVLQPNETYPMIYTTSAEVYKEFLEYVQEGLDILCHTDNGC